MPPVATLISNPRDRALSAELADKAQKAVNASDVDWLADQIALDIALPGSVDQQDAEAVLREAVADAPVDVVVQRSADRRKTILIADMDSTMIGQECIDELADEAGLKPHIAAITARAMSGEIAFEPALRERVALLKGLETSVIDHVIATRITLTPGGKTLVATMQRHGGHAALVSGGFTAFTEQIAAMIGFDEHRGNILLSEEGRLSGTVADPILGREAKTVALADIASRLGITPADAIAVGDGANDLGMLGLAGSGVALHAKPVVAAQADMRIDHGDLTALLYIQGYRQSEFVQ